MRAPPAELVEMQLVIFVHHMWYTGSTVSGKEIHSSLQLAANQAD